MLGLLLASARADAAYVTAGDLLKSCRSEKASDIFSCMSYIEGVIDYHVMMQSMGTEPTTNFCLPEDLPAENAVVAVMAYLKKSPQHQDFIAAPAVTMALQETFPCGPVVTKKKKKSGK
jgi:hypothetical protein